jgi:hypothetical protein
MSSESSHEVMEMIMSRRIVASSQCCDAKRPAGASADFIIIIIIIIICFVFTQNYGILYVDVCGM